MDLGRGRLCSLQYKPQALQLSSSLSPRLQRGVCVAPQFEHSALTPPGAELIPPALVGVWRKTAGFKLVAVAPGPPERAMGTVDCVLTVKVGRPVGVLDRGPNRELTLEGAIVWGRSFKWERVRGKGLVVRALVGWDLRMNGRAEESSSLSSSLSLLLSSSPARRPVIKGPRVFTGTVVVGRGVMEVVWVMGAAFWLSVIDGELCITTSC